MRVSIVVSNSSPLIALGRIGRLDLLPSLYGVVIIPQDVHYEVIVAAPSEAGAALLAQASWLRVHSIQDTGKRDYLLSILDPGEAEALVLAQEMGADWLLLDEIKARAAARRLSLRIIGTAGLLVTAKHHGLLPRVKPLLDQLQTHDFRLSEQVYQTVLKQAGE
jgi:predicted nucleic acid-binding protein